MQNIYIESWVLDYWDDAIQKYEIFSGLAAPRCPGMAAGAVSLRKSHDIVILSFCNIVKGQANYVSNRWFYNSIIFLEPSVFIHSFCKTPLFGTTHNKTLDKISLDNKKVPSLKQCVATGRQATFSYLKFFGWLSFIADNVLD